jgi:hypothetical protein
MILVCWEMNRSMWTCGLVVLLESMIVQYLDPGVFQTRVSDGTLDFIVASKYELGQRREKWSAGWGVHSTDFESIMVGIFTALAFSAINVVRFALL